MPRARKDEGGRRKAEKDPVHPSSFILHPSEARPIVAFDDARETVPGYAVRSDGVILRDAGRRGWLPLGVKTGAGGFRKVSLRIRGKVREIGVAHLVLRAFVGPRPFGCEPLHFPDPDLGNNHLDNLRWGRRGTSKLGRTLGPSLPLPKRGSNHVHSLLVEEDIPEIRSLYRGGVGYKEIAEKYEVNPETIRNVLLGRSWAHVPDPLGPIVMRRKGPSSVGSNLSRLDWEQAAEIRGHHAAGLSYARIAALYDVDKCTVRDIVKERTWRPENAPR
jgi:hypothetical protein